MISRIHVNQHVIRANKKTGDRNAPLTVKQNQTNIKAMIAEILLPDGTVAATIAYKPDAPLACGATIWVETSLSVRTTS
jgi:hypothetical protein